MRWEARTGRVWVGVYVTWRVMALGVGVVVTESRVEVTVGVPFVHVYLDVVRSAS